MIQKIVGMSPKNNSIGPILWLLISWYHFLATFLGNNCTFCAWRKHYVFYDFITTKEIFV